MRLLALLRLGNCFMAFLGVFIGAIVELMHIGGLSSPLSGSYRILNLSVFDSHYWGLLNIIWPGYGSSVPLIVPVLLAAIAAFLVTGAGNALNDYYDRRLDKKAHPERPIPSGIVSPKAAWNFAIILFATGLILTLLINWICVLIALLNIYLLFTYEKDLKAKGLSGNFAISYLTASVFLFGGASVLSFGLVPILFLLALLANVSREITKDIEDMKADAAYRKTLPITAGKKSAARTAIAYLWAAVALSVLPLFIMFILIQLSIWSNAFLINFLAYLGIIFVADTLFVYSTNFVIKNPRKAQSHMKLGMIVAMLAFFLLGAIPILDEFKM